MSGFGFDSLAMPDDEVEDDALPNGFVAEDQFVASDQFHQTAKDERGRKQRVHAFGIQTGNSLALLDRRPTQHLLNLLHFLQRDGGQVELR